MTPERSRYHLLMLRLGKDDEYGRELDRILDEEDPLSPLTLALAWSMSDRNETISVLYNHTLDHPCDENQVCSMILRTMARHYRDKSMTPEQISDFLYRAALKTGDYFDDPWYRLYEFSYDLEMYEDNLISRETFLAAFEARLLHDRRPDIWELQAKENRKKSI